MFNARKSGLALVSFLAAFGLAFAGNGVAVAQLLPDLTMLQPNEFRLELLSGGVRRLRFSTSIVNLGPGRFDVVGSNPDPADPTRLTRVVQRLEQNGGWVTQLTPATMFYAGDGHDHWHVFGLQDFKLAFQATPNDRVATGVKTGFCFWDNVNLANAPRFYTGATECHQQSDGTVPMGLSVDWGDKYPWSIAFQYIDISQLPNGNYCLTITADPRGEFVEVSNANNSVQTLIDIEPGGVTVLAPNCDDTTPPQRVVHVADLDRTARGKGKSGKWDASVTITIRDAAGAAVSGATVTGNWSGAISRAASGVTASNGSLTLATGSMGGTSVTFTVANVAGPGLTYSAAANTDPDGDSTGTSITIAKP